MDVKFIRTNIMSKRLDYNIKQLIKNIKRMRTKNKTQQSKRFHKLLHFIVNYKIIVLVTNS